MNSSWFNAGAASIRITPDEPMWLAGFAVRTEPAKGKLSDLFVKALAIIVVGAGCATHSSQPIATAPAQNKTSDVPRTELHVEEIKDPEGVLTERRSYYLNSSGHKVLHGPDIQFHEDGKKWREIEYRHGVMDGLLVEYSPYTGDKQREEHFRNGRRDGLSIEWCGKDRKTSECTYHDDRIVGKRLYWNLNGGLEAEEIYDNDGNLMELTTWHDNGQKAKHGRFKGIWPDLWGGPQIAGKRDGAWTYWDAHGKIMAEGIWRNGKPWEGTCIVPRQSGSLFVGEKGSYHKGNLVGPVTRELDF